MNEQPQFTQEQIDMFNQWLSWLLVFLLAAGGVLGLVIVSITADDTKYAKVAMIPAALCILAIAQCTRLLAMIGKSRAEGEQ